MLRKKQAPLRTHQLQDDEVPATWKQVLARLQVTNYEMTAEQYMANIVEEKEANKRANLKISWRTSKKANEQTKKRTNGKKTKICQRVCMAAKQCMTNNVAYKQPSRETEG